jgi:hypothetical protein
LAETATKPPAKKQLPAGATGFMRVNHPEVWPQRCVLCHGTGGPLVDTRKQGVGAVGDREDRLYVCGNCVKLCALELGLIDGERMQQLLKAGDLLDEAAVALKDRDALIERQMADLATLTRKAEALEELLTQERDRVKTHGHLFDVIEQSAIQGRQAAA